MFEAETRRLNVSADVFLCSSFYSFVRVEEVFSEVHHKEASINITHLGDAPAPLY